MKKNPLEEIYESKVLLNEEANKSNVVVPAGHQQIAKGDKVALAHGGGTEKVKKDLKTPEEAEGTDVKAGEPKKLSMTTDSLEAPKKSFEGSFEKLFKATINEQFPGEEEMGTVEMDVEVPTSNDEMVDELEGKADEVSDLVSDLKDLMSKLQSILDKVSEEAGDEKEDEVESEFGDEETPEEEVETEEKEEEKPMGEATELKPLGDKSKVLQNKNNKVGSIKPHGGKAHGGDVESDPELKPAKAHDKALQSPKGKPEVKSTVKKGEFFK
jgi:hypothetical protein